MKTTSTYSIKNDIKNVIIRTGLTFSDVRKFAFIKRSKSIVACVDYTVIDEFDNCTFPLSQIN